MLKSKRPTQKEVRLVVDVDGHTRFPLAPEFATLADYRALAAGVAEGHDMLIVVLDEPLRRHLATR